MQATFWWRWEGQTLTTFSAKLAHLQRFTRYLQKFNYFISIIRCILKRIFPNCGFACYILKNYFNYTAVLCGSLFKCRILL